MGKVIQGSSLVVKQLVCKRIILLMPLPLQEKGKVVIAFEYILRQYLLSNLPLAFEQFLLTIVSVCCHYQWVCDNNSKLPLAFEQFLLTIVSASGCFTTRESRDNKGLLPQTTGLL